MPALRKQKILPEKELRELEKQVQRELMKLAAAQNKPERLMESWRMVPRDLRQDENLIDDYARHLLRFQRHDEAEELLREAIKRHWNASFVYLYGLTKSSTLNKQLSHAEVWLKTHDNNPILLLTLGRLCLQHELWGKARAYLEASLGAGETSEAYRELGGLLEQLGEQSPAMECYRKGMLLAADERHYDTLHIDRDTRAVVRPLQSAAYVKASEK